MRGSGSSLWGKSQMLSVILIILAFAHCLSRRSLGLGAQRCFVCWRKSLNVLTHSCFLTLGTPAVSPDMSYSLTMRERKLVFSISSHRENVSPSQRLPGHSFGPPFSRWDKMCRQPQCWMLRKPGWALDTLGFEMSPYLGLAGIVGQKLGLAPATIFTVSELETLHSF